MPATLDRDVILAQYACHRRDSSRFLIGGEFERHLLDANGRPIQYFGDPSVQRLMEDFAAEGWRPYRDGPFPIALFRGKTSITLEPGGQFELSGAPYASVGEIITEAQAFAERTDAHLAGSGVTQVALGFTPFARIPEIPFIPKKRYGVMRDWMAASGPLGHHMMKGTCATQASYDFADEQDCAAKVRLAVLMGPLTTAMFANSPLAEGRPSGFASYRGFIWTQTDPARTGFPFAAEHFTYENWVDYLLDVPMMFQVVGKEWRHARGRTFRDWMANGDAGTWPDQAAWDMHVTSVFPEVRVKQTIEVRGADCVPLPLAAAFCALFEGLFYDPRALRQATAVAERFAAFGTKEARFLTAVRHGLRGTVGGRTLADWAGDLVDAAQDGLSRWRPADAGWLAPLAANVEAGLTPGDQLMAELAGDFSPARVVAAARYLRD